MTVLKDLPRTTSVDRENDRRATEVFAAFRSEVLPATSVTLCRLIAEPAIAREYYRFSSDQNATMAGAALAVPEFVSQFTEDGLNSPRVQAALRRARGYHQQLPATEDEYRRALALICLSVVEWLQKYSKRKMTEEELRVVGLFFGRMGEALGLSGVPSTIRGFQQARAGELESAGESSLANSRTLLDLAGGHRLRRWGLGGWWIVRLSLAAELDEPTRVRLQLSRPSSPVRLMSHAFWWLRSRLMAS